MFFQVSVANVENAHHSTRQWLFFVRIKKKKYQENAGQYQENDVFCRLLAQTTLRNILGTKNLHEILSDRESISSSMQVVFLYVLVQKVVGQFATNIMKQTTF